MFLLETAMGQYTSQGCITCWRHFCPLFEGPLLETAVLFLFSVQFTIFYVKMLSWHAPTHPFRLTLWICTWIYLRLFARHNKTTGAEVAKLKFVFTWKAHPFTPWERNDSRESLEQSLVISLRFWFFWNMYANQDTPVYCSKLVLSSPLMFLITYVSVHVRQRCDCVTKGPSLSSIILLQQNTH